MKTNHSFKAINCFLNFEDMATGITQAKLVTYNKNDLMHQVIN